MNALKQLHLFTINLENKLDLVNDIYSTSCQSLGQTESNSVGQTSSQSNYLNSISQFWIKDEMTKSKIFWTVHKVITHFSNRSCEVAKKYFHW